MSADLAPGADVVKRAIAWHHLRHELFCDQITPWEYGVVARASRYPTYWDLNVVRAERRPEIGTDELVAFAERALSGLEHVRIEFDHAPDGERFREQLVPLGWRFTRLVIMRHEGAVPPAGDGRIEEVPYDATLPLRVAWHDEDFPGQDAAGHQEDAREVAAKRGARVLAPIDDGQPVGFAQIEVHGDGAEITQVYMRPDRRGHGLGTALTSAAIRAGSGAGDLWIFADADDRPQKLYERLGFRPVHTLMQLTRLP
jgi:GNAT superfamily N-acetyltransferase